VVKHDRELDLIKEAGVTVRRLSSVVSELKEGNLTLGGAAGAHLVDLVAMATARGVDA
jgi:hypothetical protein